jgi:hypothetical protein
MQHMQRFNSIPGNQNLSPNIHLRTTGFGYLGRNTKAARTMR